jgi:arylsulfatase A-like enzyme
LSQTTQPNIVLIVMDDLDARSWTEMPAVVSSLREQGTGFSHAYTPTPICGPARATLLRGQYAHNHGVIQNNRQDGGFTAFHLKGREESSLATWLQNRGYRTALVGKYLNGYPRIRKQFSEQPVPRTYVPPGWDEWYGQVGRLGFEGFNYELNENGRIVAYGDRPADYFTDVLRDKALGFIMGASRSPQPWFLYVAPLAPHHPAVPAPRHAHLFPEAAPPDWPPGDGEQIGRKPAHMQVAHQQGHDRSEAIAAHYRQRLQSLQAVDEMIDALIRHLDALGVVENTYIIMTSDHGWHAGEQGLASGKQTPYDAATRVPLIVRGPGIPAGTTIDHLVLHTDIAPTIADMANAPAPSWVDGRSLMPLLRQEAVASWRRSVLIELAERNRPVFYDDLGELPSVPAYAALRTLDWLYTEYHTGERELYDLTVDPLELDNLIAIAEPSWVQALSEHLASLRVCTGSECAALENRPIPAAPLHTLRGHVVQDRAGDIGFTSR